MIIIETISEYYATLYLLAGSLVLFYYGFSNRNTQKVRARFLGNYIKLSFMLLASFAYPITYSENMGLNTIFIGLGFFCILSIIAYFDGYRFNMSAEDPYVINEIIHDVKADYKFNDFFKKHPNYDVFTQPNNGLGGGFAIKIKTGYDVSLANDIKLSMADRLSEIDDSAVNYRLYYLCSGLVIVVVWISVFM